nr:hypothetical protein [uncultured Mogibacterium sp.]
MYYRDDGGLGCLIGIFIILILLSAVMAIILSPIFWIVVGILVLFQAISNRWGSHRDEEPQQYHYRESRSYTSNNTVNNELEEEFTKDAVDVDVEVIPDDK